MIEHVIINQDKEEEPRVEMCEWLLSVSSDGKATTSYLTGKVGLNAFALIGKAIREAVLSFSEDTGLDKAIMLGLFVRGMFNETDPIRVK